MKLFKCDRCGITYDDGFKLKHDKYYINKIELITYNKFWGNYNRTSHKELCQGCSKEYSKLQEGFFKKNE